jgi:hypothetical protein
MQTNSPLPRIEHDKVVTLFRPVGLRELALLWDSGFRQFPPRLAQQPYFYPVANFEYAKQIAADWNVKDQASVFCGFVTKFSVASTYLAGFKPHVVGASVHTEYRIPAEKLKEFNQAITGRIEIEASFFGAKFEGYVPANFALKGKNATEQFVALARLWEYNSVDFTKEISANRKAIFLNSWFWAQHDFSKQKIRPEDKLLLFERLENAWAINQIDVPWPAEQLRQIVLLSSTPGGEEKRPSPGRWQNAQSRAGGRVDNVVSEEALETQEGYRQQVQLESRKRPTVITLLAISLFLYATYFLVLLALAVARPEVFHTGDPDRDSAIAFQLSVMAPLRAATGISFGIGLLLLRRWARRSLLIFSGLDIARAILGLILTGGSMKFMGLAQQISFFYCIVVIACLVSRKSSLAFESTPGASG